MLQFLKINNFLLFKDQEISFDGNFTVITGETGSGKSMFIKALKFLLGEKQDLPQMSFMVSGEFKLKNNNKNVKILLHENNIEIEDNVIILRRILDVDGKSKIFINDTSVTLKFLKKISEELVEFHSQHKQLTAFNQPNSLNLIDKFISDSYLLDNIASLFYQINKLNSEIKELKKEKYFLEIDREYLEHSLQEIDSLKLEEGEELKLIERKKIFADKVKLVSAVEDLLGNFSRDNGLINKLIRAQRNISKLEVDIGLDELIENSIFHLSELQNQAEVKLRDLDNNENIEHIEERLSKIKELARKYRCTADQLINLHEEFRSKVNKLDSINQNINSKILKEEELKKEYFKIAEELSQRRKIAAKKLECKILEELKHLKLEQVEFYIEISSNQQLNSKGIDQSKFLIKTNKGFDFAQIEEVASGGELSRIMLAFKVALAENNQINTIIFDEIDSGTGGAVAETIGNRMMKLAESNQIITISHQPQVASKADQHLLVCKNLGIDGAAIQDLDSDKKVQEIARMLAGINISDSAVMAAISLMK